MCVAHNVSKMFVLKEQAEAAKVLKEREKKDVVQTLESVIVSGAVAAVTGAVFAITKKQKEK